MQSDDPQFTDTLASQGSVRGRIGAPEPADEVHTKPLDTGDFIGRYRIKERVGEGGMGVVYAAEDPELGRLVAIKLLRPMQGDEAELQQRRMLREAQALARVSHRNLVMVFDVGSLRGRVWIAMEYVAGDTLEVWLARERRTWAEIVDVFVEAGRGLAAVHSAGLVHRDFKPGNVIVRQDGTVQVLDFGLAARAGERDLEAEARRHETPDLDVLAATLTTTGAFMGTPAYMAPEQFLMRPTDGRADQFSVCVALYEALYGHRPFTGKDLASLMAATIEGLPGLPAEMPGLPIAVRQVIARGLMREPDDRFPDMTALVQALADTRAPKEKSTPGGWRRFALGMMVGGGALAVATAVLLSQPDDAPIELPTTPSEPAPITTPAPAAITPTPTTPQPSTALPAPPIVEPAPIVADDPAAIEQPAPATGTTRTDARPLPATQEPGAPPSTTLPSALPGLKDLTDDDPEPAPPSKPSEPAPTAEPAAEPSKPVDRPEPSTPPADDPEPAQ
ncbi:MAG TPA: protein kinase [Nannocystaceae bacterium]|nr:protein kinase [Nannocystaceae bacterium]